MSDKMTSSSPSSQETSELKSFLILEPETLPEIQQTVLSPENCAELLEAVLSSSGCLHAGDVREAWSSYLELVVEPAGWRALLRPSQDTLDLLGLQMTGEQRPAMLVNVLDVMCDSLEAEVELVRISKEGEEVGNLATVPIDELFATRAQEIQTLDLASTVTAIDLIRFFYENIWMPWDEDSEVEDWPGQHLHNRVRLHFSLMTGSGDQVRPPLPSQLTVHICYCRQATAMKLDELAARAEQNSVALLELEKTARTEEEGSEAETEDSEAEEVLGRLYELHQEQESIRREAEVLENPKLRAALSSKAASARKRVRESLTREAGILLVWRSGDLARLTRVLASLTAEFGEGAEVLVYCELQQALDSSVAGDVVIITSPGHHQLNSLGSLAGGGAILARGLEEAGSDSVVLTPGDTASVILSITAGSLRLEDVVLESGNVRVSVLVSGAQLAMKNVTIQGSQTALLADKNSRVELRDCKISGTDTAVEVCSGAECLIAGSVLENNKTAVCARQGSALTVRSSEVTNNRSYGILIHSQLQPDQEGLWTGDEAVEKASQHGVKLVDTEFSRNVIGDVGVLQMKEMTGSPLLERRSKNTRRFSTPVSGKAQKLDVMETSADNQSPIPRSLARVLSYPM